MLVISPESFIFWQMDNKNPIWLAQDYTIFYLTIWCEDFFETM